MIHTIPEPTLPTVFTTTDEALTCLPWQRSTMTAIVGGVRHVIEYDPRTDGEHERAMDALLGLLVA